MSDDELVLGALECYEYAVRRVAQDFAARDGVIQPLGVELDSDGCLLVRLGRRGRTWEGLLGSLRPTLNLEHAVVELADLLQEKEFDEGDTSWPGCLPGHTHPPTAALVDGGACWRCPRADVPLSPIGQPTDTAPPA